MVGMVRTKSNNVLYVSYSLTQTKTLVIIYNLQRTIKATYANLNSILIVLAYTYR